MTTETWVIPTATPDGHHYAVLCPDGTIGEPCAHRADAETEARNADLSHDGAVCTEPHRMVSRPDRWLILDSPPGTSATDDLCPDCCDFPCSCPPDEARGLDV